MNLNDKSVKIAGKTYITHHSPTAKSTNFKVNCNSTIKNKQQTSTIIHQL